MTILQRQSEIWTIPLSKLLIGGLGMLLEASVDHVLFGGADGEEEGKHTSIENNDFSLAIFTLRKRSRD